MNALRHISYRESGGWKSQFSDTSRDCSRKGNQKFMLSITPTGKQSIDGGTTHQATWRTTVAQKESDSSPETKL